MSHPKSPRELDRGTQSFSAVSTDNITLLKRIRPWIRQVPVLGYLSGRTAWWLRCRKLRRLSTQEVFTDIFQRNSWDSALSVSGQGSDLRQTAEIAKQLPDILRKIDAHSVLDVPCGDFHWMRNVNLSGIQYLGADIVPELICRNQRYETENITFRHIDLLTDPLPKMDVVFNRDCLVHFSFADVRKALQNICASGGEYLITTTFPGRARNRDIPTGEWRTLDLESEPFLLPKPRMILRDAAPRAMAPSRTNRLDYGRFVI